MLDETRAERFTKTMKNTPTWRYVIFWVQHKRQPVRMWFCRWKNRWQINGLQGGVMQNTRRFWVVAIFVPFVSFLCYGLDRNSGDGNSRSIQSLAENLPNLTGEEIVQRMQQASLNPASLIETRTASLAGVPVPVPPKVLTLTNAFLIDCTGREPIQGATVVIEGDRIKEVLRPGQAGDIPADAVVLNLHGMTLMPGLTDAHVHLAAATLSMAAARTVPEPQVAILAAQAIRETLMRGFTTVRDAGYLHPWFRTAVDQGMIVGPRVLAAGRPITQTGGHADGRQPGENIPPFEGWYYGKVADGVDAVRQAVREQLRRGADQIKVMASGGVMSPADEIDSAQYSFEELKVAVDEAGRAHKYVMAHAYSNAAVLNAVKAGVRSIEHGNLIGDEAAEAMKQAGTYLVPTMVTYDALWQAGRAGGLSPDQLKKLAEAREKSVESLRLAYNKGVKIALGSDLLGPMRNQEAAELELQGQVQSPMEVLISATKTNAELFRMQDKIGTVEPGKLADLIVVKGNPLGDLHLFQNPDNLFLIMKGGILYKNALSPGLGAVVEPHGLEQAAGRETL